MKTDMSEKPKEENEHTASSGLDDPTCSAGLPREQDELARDIACFLWESSTLRHGLFTPPEFIPLVSRRIRQYFYEQNSPVLASEERGS